MVFLPTSIDVSVLANKVKRLYFFTDKKLGLTFYFQKKYLNTAKVFRSLLSGSSKLNLSRPIRLS